MRRFSMFGNRTSNLQTIAIAAMNELLGALNLDLITLKDSYF